MTTYLRLKSTTAPGTPPSGYNYIYLDTADNIYKVKYDTGAVVAFGSAGAWGTIFGTLSNQTDLQSALNAKQNSLSFGNLSGTANRTSISGGTGSVIGSGSSVDIDTGLLPSPLIGDIGKALIASAANTAAWTTVSTTDEKVKASVTDTTTGYLGAKIAAGTGITLTTLNPGANEVISISATATGSVTAVSGTAPVVSSGGTTPAISMAAATNSGDGYLTAVDHTKFTNKQPSFNGLEDPTLFGLAYSASTRQFTITYSVGAEVTVGGVRFAKTGSTVTTAHANTSGLWYCYYDVNGTIQVSNSFWDLKVTAPVALAYYTTSNNGGAASAILSDERHPGVTGMDNATHINLHTTRGTQVVSALTASGYTLNASGLANVSYALSAGVIADEDIVLNTAAQLQGGANTYRVLWKTGISGTPVWNWIDDAEGGLYSDGTNIYYNQLTGGSWQKTALSANGFVNYWVIAITAASAPQCVIMMGQTTYASLALAQAATFSSEMSDVGLFTAEGVVLYRMTYQRSAAFGTPGNSRLVSVTNVSSSLVNTAGSPGTVGPGGSTGQAQFNNAGVFSGVPGSDFSDVNGCIIPRRITFSLPGPRVVQTDCTNWVILGRAGKFVKAWAVAKTAPTGAAFILDILKSNDNGVTWATIWSTSGNRVQMAATVNNGVSTTFDTTTYAAGDILRIDVAQIGSTVAGSDVSVLLDTASTNI